MIWHGQSFDLESGRLARLGAIPRYIIFVYQLAENDLHYTDREETTRADVVAKPEPRIYLLASDVCQSVHCSPATYVRLAGPTCDAAQVFTLLSSALDSAMVSFANRKPSN